VSFRASHHSPRSASRRSIAVRIVGFMRKLSHRCAARQRANNREIHRGVSRLSVARRLAHPHPVVSLSPAAFAMAATASPRPGAGRAGSGHGTSTQFPSTSRWHLWTITA
jgi:hypothetical protein